MDLEIEPHEQAAFEANAKRLRELRYKLKEINFTHYDAFDEAARQVKQKTDKVTPIVPPRIW